MTSTAMKRLGFILILAIGGIVCAVDLWRKSATTRMVNELLALLQSNDAAAMEEGLMTRYQTSATQAQRIRIWVVAHHPIRSLALRRNGDGFAIMPDQASHYVVIKGQREIGHLAVNFVAEQPPRSALMIVNDDLSSLPITAPGVSVGQ